MRYIAKSPLESRPLRAMQSARQMPHHFGAAFLYAGAPDESSLSIRRTHMQKSASGRICRLIAPGQSEMCEGAPRLSKSRPPCPDFSLPPTSLQPSIPHSTRPSPPLPPSHPPTPSAPSHPFRPQVRETSPNFAGYPQKRPILLLVVQHLDL